MSDQPVFLYDESDLSDATQARRKDVAECSGEYPECSHAFDHAHPEAVGGPWRSPRPLTPLPDHLATTLGGGIETPALVPPGESYDGPGWDKATRSIVSLAGLNWAGGVLREIRAAMVQNEEMAKGEIEALEHKLAVARLRLDRAQKPLKADAEFFERAISTYAQTHKAEILKGYGKSQSRRFPSGLKVAWKSRDGHYRWRQDMTPKEREEALLRWVNMEEEASGESLTEYVPRPDLDEIKRHLADLGDAERAEALAGQKAPPGLEWVEQGESIKIQVGEEK